MAFSIAKTGTREVTITADADDVLVLVQRALPSYSLETYTAQYTVSAGNSSTITYDEDGIYKIGVTERAVLSNYIDLCVEDVYDHIETDVLDLLNIPVNVVDYSSKRYDFIAITLLGLQFFGNTAYALYLDVTEWTILPDALKVIQDSIVRSKKYIELNATTTQSTN